MYISKAVSLPSVLFIECRTILCHVKTREKLGSFLSGQGISKFLFKVSEFYLEIAAFITIFSSIHTRLIILAAQSVTIALQSVKSQGFFCLGGWQLCCSPLTTV